MLPLAVVPLLIGLNREAMTEQVLRLHAVAARTAAAQVSEEVAGWQRTATSVRRANVTWFTQSPGYEIARRNRSADVFAPGLLEPTRS